MGNRMCVNQYDPKRDLSGMVFGFMHVDFPTSSSDTGSKLLYSCTDTSTGKSGIVFYGDDLFYYRRLSEKVWNIIRPGMRFGKWTTIEQVAEYGNPRKIEIWVCRSDSGMVADCSRHYLETYGLAHPTERLYGFEDLTGKLFGKLKAIRRAYFDDHNSTWRCECQCPSHTILYRRIKDLKTQSNSKMSCKKCERDAKHIYEFDELPIYHIFKGMKQRCYNPKNTGYFHYGGRGIRICDEWLNSPKAFTTWALQHGYKKGLSIDRINVNGDYCPENCRWATDKEQLANTTRQIIYTINGMTKSLPCWAKIIGLPSWVVAGMIRKYGDDYVIKYITEYLNKTS